MVRARRPRRPGRCRADPGHPRGARTFRGIGFCAGPEEPGPAAGGMARQDVRSRALAMGERDPAVLAEVVERCLAYAGPIDSMIDVGGSVGHLAREFPAGRKSGEIEDDLSVRDDVVVSGLSVGLESKTGDHCTVLHGDGFPLTDDCRLSKFPNHLFLGDRLAVGKGQASRPCQGKNEAQQNQNSPA